MFSTEVCEVHIVSCCRTFCRLCHRRCTPRPS